MASSSCSGRVGWPCRSGSARRRACAASRAKQAERNPAMANVYYEKDADAALIAGRKVAIIGYGSQGHAHALNLKESGSDGRVGLREGSASKAKAEAAGLPVTSVAKAAAEADLVMILLPDTEQKRVYEADIAPNLADGDALFFAHGFNIRFS